MTRDEASKLLDTESYPDDLRMQDHELMAKNLGISTTELDEISASRPRHYADHPNGEAAERRVFAFAAWWGGALRRIRKLR